MKYAIVIPDGMCDYPIEELKNRTPLEVARTPNFDKIASSGRIGRVRTVPEGVAPGSDVANLSLLGYDPRKYYTGRAPLEAASMNIALGETDWAFRCNLVTIFDEKLIDYSAGAISSDEAQVLIKLLDECLGTDSITFYPGLSYRHLLVIRDMDFADLVTVPPHDIMGRKFHRHLPEGAGAKTLIDLIGQSSTLLENHEINNVRRDLGENPANMIWLWGQGMAPLLPVFAERYGLAGAVVCAVDLIKGLAKYIGWDVINVAGANGGMDTNFKGKGRAAVEALEEYDVVFVHVEAPDEASHQGSLQHKIAAIENVDRFVAGPLLSALESGDEPYRMMVLPDHYTPLSLRTHSSEPVPFAICGTGFEHEEPCAFHEARAKESNFFINEGHALMEYFIKRK